MPSTSKPQPKSRRRALAITGTVLALAGGGSWWAVSANGSADAPAASVLGAQTRMGAVHLITADLDPMRAYYVDVLGLGVLDENDTALSLGRGGDEVLTITEDPDGTKDSPGQAGLYHSAFLYENESSLASAMAKVAGAAPNSFQGSADHAVSLAFYLGDPDGNGIELYVDRPADGWKWKDGKVTMGSAPLDPNAFISKHLGAGTAGDPGLGHVHLRVGDLEQARAFYADTLGFAVTAEANGALFFAAGGYHHHIATNTWSSQGAGTRSNDLGLGSFTVQLGSTDERTSVEARLNAAGIDHRNVDGNLVTKDPWGNTVTLTAP
ncbi:catechol 2,3-dioxygenase [Arthrobacter ginsengisoli]|uniref:Catechol 2,3-dioxygenase n=1 Tax=Arthrobacter ginsengisoli TaxID=1356565 RepID=A0ABU1U6N0_9MICC|nr:VOC family protein [Arthrobacter ginsengisoli]MDR7080839.1 catechol 2,3-dioxygenase [Arthrobacter ginsengisoli]